MKAVFRFIAAHNVFPICITFVCYRYFSTLNQRPTDYFFTFGASFFCWLFYWIDKTRDNGNNTFEPTDRHYLSGNDKIIQWCIGLFLAVITLFHFHPVPLKNLLIFSIAIPVSIFYLLIANTSKKMVKESFASLIIATTLCFIPIVLNSDFDSLILIPLFYLMVFGNMLILGIVERAYDLKHRFNSISTGVGKRTVIMTLITIMLTMLLFAMYIGKTEVLIWVVIYCMLYSLILVRRKKYDLNLLHLLADAVFLIPLLFSL